MQEKSINTNADGCLVLILPLAVLIIFLFTTWPVLLAILILVASFNAWQRYEWQQWSQQVNPIFNRLIQENQGRITAVDLAMKANFSAATAKRYLESKADEFGAQRQDYEDMGSVYYFITSSTLGSILDESEPQQLDEPIEDVKQPILPIAVDQSKDADAEVGVINSEAQAATESVNSEVASRSQQAQSSNTDLPNLLIQSELAKRLGVYSSTVYKRRDDPDFSEWSRSKDPDGIAWKYLPKTKEFSPVGEESKD